MQLKFCRVNAAIKSNTSFTGKVNSQGTSLVQREVHS